MRKRRETLLTSRNALWRVLAGAALMGLSVYAVMVAHAASLHKNSAVQSVAATTPTPLETTAAQSTSTVTSTPVKSPYLYFVLKQNNGYVLARSPASSTSQPTTPPQVIATFDDGFGQSTADNVVSLQLSPDALFLAIDGTHSDGELVWIFDTRTLTLKREPASVSGTFLHWLPGDSGLFLYRPMFPLGPDGSTLTTVWNPGLWIGNADKDTFTNIQINVPSSELIDALGSPDDKEIIYSTCPGLGLGSDIWKIDMDGLNLERLMRLDDYDPQSIAGMFSWSPDGQSIAYERLDDSPTPFLAASLWIMDRHGQHQRRLAQADGGHGFLLRWSPDSTKIAFVARTNPKASMADQSVQALQSAVDVVSVSSGRVWSVASPAETGVQLNTNPSWSADSSHITFAAYNPLNPVLGGSVRYWSAQVNPNGVRPSLVASSQSITRVIALG